MFRQPVAHTAPREGKTPHTPWAWVPRELEDDDSPQPSSAAQYQSAPQSQQPSPVEPCGRQNGTTAPVTVGGTGYPGHGLPSHAYFSVPADQQQQQQQQQPSAATAGSGSRLTLPPPVVYSAHVRQQSNPHQTATTTHHQPSAAPGSQRPTSLPSQPTAPPMQRSHTLAAPTPQRPGLPESFRSAGQLRPTFSPAIVRTPNHYRHDSQPVVPSPRVTLWDEANGNSNGAGVSISANRHLSGALQSGVVPSPRVLPWSSAHARANDGGSPTPGPRHPRSSRTEPSRIYETSARTLQPMQRSYSIPEPPRNTASVSRQNSMPIVPPGPDSHHHGSVSIADLPQFAEEPGTISSLSPLVGAVSSVSSESSTSTVVLNRGSPPPLITPPRHSRSPTRSPRHWRSRSASRGSSSSSSPCSSDSEDSDSDSDPGRRQHRRHRQRHHQRYHSPSDRRNLHHRTNSGPHSGGHPHGGPVYGGGAYPVPGPYTPQGRSPASSTHTYRSSSSSNPLPTPPQERRDPGFSLPPPQQPKPPRGTYRRAVRYGYWNRRGDYLTLDKYVVYAPHGHENPPDLEGYPLPTEGYKDHLGHFEKYDPTRRELPESLPRQGQPPMLPYNQVSSFIYFLFFLH